jgi:hypothetical protein
MFFLYCVVRYTDFKKNDLWYRHYVKKEIRKYVKQDHVFFHSEKQTNKNAIENIYYFFPEIIIS